MKIMKGTISQEKLPNSKAPENGYVKLQVIEDPSGTQEGRIPEVRTTGQVTAPPA